MTKIESRIVAVAMIGILGVSGTAAAEQIGWVSLTLLDDPNGRAVGSKSRVTGIYCSAADTCVVSTDSWNGGVLYSANATSVTGILLSGKKLARDVGLRVFHIKRFERYCHEVEERKASATTED